MSRSEPFTEQPASAPVDAGFSWTRVSFQKVIWLLPLAYAVHIVEEYVGGFPDWVTDVVRGSMDNRAFALNNALFMVILLGLTVWTSRTRSQFATFLLLTWASANIFWDFLFHLFTTVFLDRYSPGLITAVLLYYPLALFVGWRVLREHRLSRGQLADALIIGAALLGFVAWYGLFHFAT